MLAGLVGGAAGGVGAALINAVGPLVGHQERTSNDGGAVGQELLEDLRTMPDSETVKLRRRHREALERGEGESFAASLARIPPDAVAGRSAMLKYLNDLSDEDFGRSIQLLEFPRSTSDRLAGHIKASADRVERSKRKSTHA